MSYPESGDASEIETDKTPAKKPSKRKEGSKKGAAKKAALKAAEPSKITTPKKNNTRYLLIA